MTAESAVTVKTVVATETVPNPGVENSDPAMSSDARAAQQVATVALIVPVTVGMIVLAEENPETIVVTVVLGKNAIPVSTGTAKAPATLIAVIAMSGIPLAVRAPMDEMIRVHVIRMTVVRDVTLVGMTASPATTARAATRPAKSPVADAVTANRQTTAGAVTRPVAVEQSLVANVEAVMSVAVVMDAPMLRAPEISARVTVAIPASEASIPVVASAGISAMGEQIAEIVLAATTVLIVSRVMTGASVPAEMTGVTDARIVVKAVVAAGKNAVAANAAADIVRRT